MYGKQIVLINGIAKKDRAKIGLKWIFGFSVSKRSMS